MAVPELVVVARAIGWKALAALDRSAGSATVLTDLRRSVYLLAAGEIIWLGSPGSELHARAIHAEGMPAHVPRTIQVATGTALEWRGALPPATSSVAAAITAGASALRSAIRTASHPGEPGQPADGLGHPDGLARLLGRSADFGLSGEPGNSGAPACEPIPASALGDPPVAGRDALDTVFLARAAAPARSLAAGCACNEPERAVDAAARLIGLGPGLTPSGDDFVGGAFFARALLTRHTADADRWRAAAERVATLARERTHPISAALLRDLTEGHGHDAVHEIAVALGESRSLPRVIAAVQRLTRLGHSSGWDLLAGFLAGSVTA